MRPVVNDHSLYELNFLNSFEDSHKRFANMKFDETRTKLDQNSMEH